MSSFAIRRRVKSSPPWGQQSDGGAGRAPVAGRIAGNHHRDDRERPRTHEPAVRGARQAERDAPGLAARERELLARHRGRLPRRSRRSMRHRCSACGQRTRRASERRRDTRTRRGHTRHPRRGLILRRDGHGRRRGSAQAETASPARRRTASRGPSLQVPAVVDRAAADGDLAADGRCPRVAPAFASRGCRVPGRSAVHGDLDAADPPAAAVCGGAADGDVLPGDDGQCLCAWGPKSAESYRSRPWPQPGRSAPPAAGRTCRRAG